MCADSVKSIKYARSTVVYQNQISKKLYRNFAIEKSDKVSRILSEEHPFQLSWSHYVKLMRVENEMERQFYEIESIENNWSLPELKRQDLGQMQMYVNYYDRFEKTDEENPTIGILLCNEKKDALVELTLPKDSNIYASKYRLYLPDKKVLMEKLGEWMEEEGGAIDGNGDYFEQR